MGNTADTTADAPSADAKAAAEAGARAQAVRTGVPVPVPELTTETDTVVARPDGVMVLKRTVEPSRTRKSGVWRDLDPTLARAADGTVRPGATTGDLTLGGGGSTLLASMTNGGRKLTFTWPTALPTPVLAGDAALYPGVLPDVDLKVTAGEQGGFTHTLIVKTPAAAKNPQLATLRLGMTTDGVAVTEGGDGSLTAKGTDGNVAFVAPAPTMWDSRTTPKQAPAAKAAGTANASEVADGAIPADQLVSTDRRPGTHATTAPLETSVAGASLTLTPDAGLLNAADTVFPVYVDPPWVPLRDNVSWYGWAQDAYPTTVGYGRTDYQPGAGYQRWREKTGLERTFYRVDYNWAGRLDGKLIKRVTFNTTQVDSAVIDCSPDVSQPVYLHLVSDTLTFGTHWNNQPADYGLWSTAWAPSSRVESHCGSRLVDFDITANLAGHQNWEFITLGVYGKESPQSTANNGFKRFSRTAADNFVYIEYNTPPTPPTNRRMTPVPVNGGASGNDGYVGAVNPAVGGVSLYATVADPDPGQTIDANFVVTEVGNGNPVVHTTGWISKGASGHEARADIPPGILQDGHTYRWAVQTGDGDVPSAFADGQTFTVDGTPPTQPEITSTDYPVAGGGKTVGDKGVFVFDKATDAASGVDTIEYSLGSTIPVGWAARATLGTDGKWRTDALPVLRWGTNTLWAQSVDRAGNRSQPKAYAFYAPANVDARPVLGDINGDGRADLLTIDDTGALRMYNTNTDPALGGTIASRTFQGPAGTEDQPSWAGSLITHRGGAGITYDDLYAHAGGQLYRYATAGAGAHGEYFTSGVRDGVTRPDTCVDATRPNGTCAAYTTDWSRVRQILAPGNVDNDLSPTRAARLDLLTLENNGDGSASLWLFHGDTSAGEFDKAIPLGTADWRNLDLIAPGDATGDGLPDLWARDRTTGKLYQYASKTVTNPTTGAVTVDVTALGDAAARTLIGTGFDVAAHPRLTSDGDLDGDGKPDLWSRTPDGRVYTFLGTTPDATGHAFKPATVIADTPESVCETFDNGAAKGDPARRIQLCGPVLAKYKDLLKSSDTTVNLPLTGVLADTDGVGKYAEFQGADANATTAGASIHWAPTSGGAWSVRGNIRNKWLTDGGTHGTLGYPVSDENRILDGAGTPVGAVSVFAGTNEGTGAIAWTGGPGGTGAHTITGDFYDRWQAGGGARGDLGFPSMEASPTTLKQPGRYQQFRILHAGADTGSLYWSPTTGAWPVYGKDRQTWAAQGWEGGPLGFPTGDQYTVAGGHRSDFQGGYIRYTTVLDTATAHTNPADSTAGQRTEYTGDFDGDHRADILTTYDHGSESTSFFVSPGLADGTVGAPRQAWVSHPGWFDNARAKYAIGDFNGDGRNDVAALYGYPDGSTRLITFAARLDGTFDEGVPGTRTEPGTRDWTKAALLAGDFDGDHRDDLAMIYDHGNEDTGTWTWTAKPDGTFNDALASWRSGPGNWGQARGKYVSGDFDGDGRDDIAVMYGYGSPSGGAVALFTLKSRADGGFNDPVKSWNVPAGNWEWDHVQLVAGDFDGDHRADTGAMYDYGNGDTALFTFHARPDAGFDNDVQKWRSGPGQWSNNDTKALAGDFDGNQRADVGAMYEWADGSTTTRTLTTNTDGTVNAPAQGWRAPPGTW
ncbi:FG-GAP-like repeat-containing protein [Embleya hyalina]|uniref:FG-GAP-like repeat-containing protein n=1 Tax=Embleya hyalina TaxID=516124 RepID=UPI000F841742|nr:FG-GAP-like repeat-containing protein [Embleya hyalina]